MYNLMLTVDDGMLVTSGSSLANLAQKDRGKFPMKFILIIIMGSYVDIFRRACKQLTWGLINLSTGTKPSHLSLLTFGASKQAGQFSGMTGRSLLSAN
jgi:hypothetical protein